MDLNLLFRQFENELERRGVEWRPGDADAYSDMEVKLRALEDRQRAELQTMRFENLGAVVEELWDKIDEEYARYFPPPRTE